MSTPAVPSREAVIQQQLECLLAVSNSLQGYLLAPWREIENIPGSAPEIQKEAATAAANTFVKVCERLDSILDDKGRWEIGAVNELYQAAADAQRAQTQALKVQQAVLELNLRPCARFNPTVVRIENEFVAVYGDINREGAAIVGRGPTPEAALVDFDAAFHRTAQEQVVFEEDEGKNKKK